MEDLAAADGFIGCYTDKYYWQFWRPITAIREADTDGGDRGRPELDTPVRPGDTPVRAAARHPALPRPPLRAQPTTSASTTSRRWTDGAVARPGPSSRAVRRRPSRSLQPHHRDGLRDCSASRLERRASSRAETRRVSRASERRLAIARRTSHPRTINACWRDGARHACLTRSPGARRIQRGRTVLRQWFSCGSARDVALSALLSWRSQPAAEPTRRSSRSQQVISAGSRSFDR